MSKIVAHQSIKFITFLLSLELSGLAVANSKTELANYICHKTNIVWENVLHESILNKKFIGAVEDIADSNNYRFGPCKDYKIINQDDILFVYEDVLVLVEVTVANGRITGVWLKDSRILRDSIKKIKEDLNKLSGKISVSISKENGTKLFDYNADVPLSIASSFKLFVLKVLEDKIQSGEIKWNDVVFLKENKRSYPSGIMQDWIAEASVTIKTLATLMISLSDNTATDMLIDHLGRKTIEQYVQKNVPFMNTKEMFILEQNVNKRLLKKYLNGDYETKLKILNNISSKRGPQLNFGEETQPHIDNLGWFATTSELCETALTLKNEPILGINKGIIADRKKWAFIGYKGGSESGVRQYTQILKSKKGNWYCASTTWNSDKDDVINDSLLSAILNRLIVLLPMD